MHWMSCGNPGKICWAWCGLAVRQPGDGSECQAAARSIDNREREREAGPGLSEGAGWVPNISQ